MITVTTFHWSQVRKKGQIEKKTKLKMSKKKLVNRKVLVLTVSLSECVSKVINRLCISRCTLRSTIACISDS